MASPAADLQKKHLEGAPDPFPSLRDTSTVNIRTNGHSKEELDTGSHSAFPSLASPSPSVAPPTKSVWGSPSTLRAKPPLFSRQPVVSDSFALQVDLSNTGKDGKPASLGEVMKQVMAKYKVKLEASANQKTRQTTFHIKADTQRELERAKRTLLAQLSPVVTLILNAPASTIASIVGTKGATLNQIRDQTTARIDIPRRDTLNPPDGSHANSRKATPTPDDDDDEPTVPITITAPHPLAYEAQALLNQIILSKTSKTTQRVRQIPSHIFPFVAAQRADFEALVEGADLTLALNSAEREIAVSGDRFAVPRAIEAIHATVEGFKTNLTSLKVSIPKRQHRLLRGDVVDDIMTESRCSIVVANLDDPNDEVVIWGQNADLPTGLTAALKHANSKLVQQFLIPGSAEQSRQMLTYMAYIGYARSLKSVHPNVSIHIPQVGVVGTDQVLNIDIVGELQQQAAIDAVVRQLSEFFGKLVGTTQEVAVDWLIHRFLAENNGKRLKQCQEAHHVLVFFPPESDQQSSLLLVYDPLSPSSPTHNEKKKHLDEVSAEILKMAAEIGEAKSETVFVEKKWHRAVLGRNGTTLNAIIGADNALSIKLGATAGDPSTEDVILVRGASDEVDRAVREILQIVEDAKNDEIVSSYFTEFDIERDFVGRIVGAQGAGVNKLRDQLGVRIEFTDDTDEKDKEVGKKKKVTHQRSKVKITGRKENVEEAKKRILTQVEKLADETFEILKIPSQYHSALIGQNGKYAIRLEEKYSVKITFPRQSVENGEGRTREPLKSDEVLLKGGKKGVAGAKSELLDVLEFEKESNQILEFEVPTRSVPRILGKGGANINEIKDNTDAQIDIDRGAEDNGSTHITVRGTKAAVAAAKAAILAISDQVGEEASATVFVESKFHPILIGAGGQGLKELVTRCGGPSDPKQQAGLFQFPRRGELSDEVHLRGEPKLVEKLKIELERTVAALRDRVVLAVGIPTAQHRVVIGRGGQHLNDLQNRLGVQVRFPGSRAYHQVGEPENTDDLKDVDPDTIVKIIGSPSACQAAINELKGKVRDPAPEGVPTPNTSTTTTLLVPLKYHHAISQQGHFFRNLRPLGVQVEHSTYPKNPPVPTRPMSEMVTTASPARIDNPEPDLFPEIEWQVLPNYQDAEEGESEWTIKARDPAALEHAQKLIKDAIEHAQKMTHIGFLTLADRSVFPRIVGAKGANVARLRVESGADITVGREDNTIVIIGSEASILSAKSTIMDMVSNSRRSQRSRQD